MTALQQNYARKHSIPIDLLTHDFNIMVDEEPLMNPENGAFIKGVFLSGARWDRLTRQLVEQFPNILFDSLPIIWIFPIEQEYSKNDNCYMCPLYITSERRGILSTTGN